MKILKSIVLKWNALVHRDILPKIVFYHDIGKKWTEMGTDAQVFFEHMRVIVGENRLSSYASFHLRQGYGGQDGEQDGGLKGKRKADVVCFDDGFRGVWEYREELKKIVGVGVKVIVFIAVRLVGAPGYLTWDEIRTLQNEYGIIFQCHTWNHQTLVGEMIDESPKEERTEEWYKRELVESRLRLEEELNLGEGREKMVVVDELCFPVGNFNDELIERCKKAGYKKVYASYPGNLGEGYVQPRCLVQDLGVMGLKSVLNGGMNPLANRYKAMHKGR